LAKDYGADLVELRLDRLERLETRSVAALFGGLSGLGLPTVATIMVGSIFGGFHGTDRMKADLLLEASAFADYVDVGLEMDPRVLEELLERLEGRSKVILSLHSKSTMRGSEILKIIKEHDPSYIYKVAMPASEIKDNLLALEACSSLEGYRRIVFCYGPLGAISRVMSPFFGSEWSFASLAKGKETAPGQMDIGTLRKIQEALA
jgi:3-dehydroquinate dehydratase type I